MEDFGDDNNFDLVGESEFFRSFSLSNDIGVLRILIVLSNEFDRVFGGLVVLNIFKLSEFFNIERDGRVVLINEFVGR
jgi:hypothetical protein